MPKEKPSTGPIQGLYGLFSSVSLTITLLSILAISSIIGTLVPQNQNPEVYFRAYGEFFFKIFAALKLFDMYHSWWFQTLLILLTLNIVICSIERLPGVWKIVFNVQSRFKASRFQNKPGNIEFVSNASLETLQKTAEAVVSKTYSRTQITPTDKGIMIFGEKWRWSRLGVYIVHLSVVLLLIGGVIGSLFGFDGFAQIVGGQTIDTIRIRNTGQVLSLPFKIRCDGNSVKFYKNGAPEEFRSNLAVIENDREILQKSIIVNDPLRYGGINFFLSSYGEIEAEQPAPEAIAEPEEVQLSITVVETGMSYQQKTAIGQPFDLPEGLGKFVITEFKAKAAFMGQAIGEALVGILTLTNEQPVEITLPIRFANFDKMRRGKLIFTVLEPKPEQKMPDPNREKEYYMVLEVTKDPGVWVVYAGFILMLAGCVVAFFMPHQQAFVEITAKGKQSQVVVAGTTYRNKMAMKRKVGLLAKKLGARSENNQ